MRDASPSPPPTPFVAAGVTDIGRQRKHNEDHVLVRSELALFAVADGMGGHNAGDIASKLAATSLCNYFEATADGKVVPYGSQPDDAKLSAEARRLVAAIRKANHDVFEISCTHHQHSGMGSTLVALHVDAEAARIHVGHVGDSRCYRVRDGKIELLTRDHSLVNDALDLKPDLSEDELARLPRNIITRALGMKANVKVDIRTEPVEPGDIYLLCSDGLSGLLKDDQIVEVFSITDDMGEACELLVAMANDAGGTDNISAIAVRIQRDGEVDEREAARLELQDAATDPAEQQAAPEPDPIQRLKGHVAEGVVELLQAGAEVDLNADTLLNIPEEVRIARCSKCQSELFVGNLFCVECGTPIQ